MVTELAMLIIDQADGEEFENTYQNVGPILHRQSGYLSDRLMWAIDRPEEYILVVKGESMADHERFIETPDYPELDRVQGEYVWKGCFAHNQIITG